MIGVSIIRDGVVPYCIKKAKETIQTSIRKILVKLSILLLIETLFVAALIYGLQWLEIRSAREYIIRSYENLQTFQMMVALLKMALKLHRIRVRYGSIHFVHQKTTEYLILLMGLAILQTALFLGCNVIYLSLLFGGILLTMRKELYYTVLLQRWIVDRKLLKTILFYGLVNAACLFFGPRTWDVGKIS